jgi:hypothetical protein
MLARRLALEQHFGEVKLPMVENGLAVPNGIWRAGESAGAA